MNFDFTPVWDNIPTLLSGTGYTLFIALFAAILSLVGGLAVALTTLYGKNLFSYPLRFFIGYLWARRYYCNYICCILVWGR
jgi:ABC-type amino acid transport system permease subunit